MKNELGILGRMVASLETIANCMEYFRDLPEPKEFSEMVKEIEDVESDDKLAEYWVADGFIFDHEPEQKPNRLATQEEIDHFLETGDVNVKSKETGSDDDSQTKTTKKKTSKKKTGKKATKKVVKKKEPKPEIQEEDDDYGEEETELTVDDVKVVLREATEYHGTKKPVMDILQGVTGVRLIGSVDSDQYQEVIDALNASMVGE